jgi:hypothetical protein
MFPAFPLMFPVCSQFQAMGFIVFPAFWVSAVHAISSISCIYFLRARNTENSGNWTTTEGLALRAR